MKRINFFDKIAEITEPGYVARAITDISKLREYAQVVRSELVGKGIATAGEEYRGHKIAGVGFEGRDNCGYLNHVIISNEDSVFPGDRKVMKPLLRDRLQECELVYEEASEPAPTV